MSEAVQVGRSKLGGDGCAFAPNGWIGGHCRHGGLDGGSDAALHNARLFVCHTLPPQTMPHRAMNRRKNTKAKYSDFSDSAALDVPAGCYSDFFAASSFLSNLARASVLADSILRPISSSRPA